MEFSYEDERAAAAERRKQRHAETRARVVLSRVGWSASEDAIIAEIDSMSQDVKQLRSDRPAIVAAALRLQQEEISRARRLSPEEVAQLGRVYGVPEEKRPRIRERITTLITETPDLPREAVRITINREFEVEIQPENFRVSYWIPAGGTSPKRSAARAKRAAPAAAAAVRPAAKRAAKPRTSRLLFRLIELEELPNDRAALRIAVGGYEFTLDGVRA